MGWRGCVGAELRTESGGEELCSNASQAASTAVPSLTAPLCGQEIGAGTSTRTAGALVATFRSVRCQQAATVHHGPCPWPPLPLPGPRPLPRRPPAPGPFPTWPLCTRGTRCRWAVCSAGWGMAELGGLCRSGLAGTGTGAARLGQGPRPSNTLRPLSRNIAAPTSKLCLRNVHFM